MDITTEMIKELRAKTSAGMALCKEALVKCDGDMEEAKKYINDRSDVVARLHNLTGAKIGLCKIAFEDAGKDFEKAVEIIKDKGWEGEIVADPTEKKEGVIGTYVHGVDQRTVALIEIICQTDFVAKNEKFREFAEELAMQVAATKPEYVSRESIPAEKLKELEEKFQEEARSEGEGKPEDIISKIAGGKLDKYCKVNCLMEQEWFKDSKKSIKELFDDTMVTIGEPMELGRMLVWTLGEA